MSTTALTATAAAAVAAITTATIATDGAAALPPTRKHSTPPPPCPIRGTRTAPSAGGMRRRTPPTRRPAHVEAGSPARSAEAAAPALNARLLPTGTVAGRELSFGHGGDSDGGGRRRPCAADRANQRPTQTTPLRGRQPDLRWRRRCRYRPAAAPRRRHGGR